MWTDTLASRLLEIAYPIVQGPFGGGLSSIALTATVSTLGGLGSFGVHHLGPDQIQGIAASIRERTSRPFALNLWVGDADPDMSEFDAAAFEQRVARLAPYYAELGLPTPRQPDRFAWRFDEQIEGLLAAAPPVFSFCFGIPDPRIIERCRAKRIITMGTATTVAEARAIEAAGVDSVVATGFEAGGHRVSFLKQPETCLTGTFSLIPQVRDAVRIPVIAAGGIADGRGIAAAMALGADAVQIGTAFLGCDESGANGLHRAALFTEQARDTVLIRAFSGRLARGIRNRLADDFADGLDLAPYPAQNWLTGGLRAAAIEQGRADLISLWSGQSAALLKHRNAEHLFKALIELADSASAA